MMISTPERDAGAECLRSLQGAGHRSAKRGYGEYRAHLSFHGSRSRAVLVGQPRLPPFLRDAQGRARPQRHPRARQAGIWPQSMRDDGAGGSARARRLDRRDRRLVAGEHPPPSPAAGRRCSKWPTAGSAAPTCTSATCPSCSPRHVPATRCRAIVALGDGLASWQLGDRVTVLPFAQCGECELCRSGQEQVCPHAIPNGVGLGTGRPVPTRNR